MYVKAAYEKNGSLSLCSKIKRIRLKNTRKVYGLEVLWFYNFDLVWQSFTDKQSMVLLAVNKVATFRLQN